MMPEHVLEAARVLADELNRDIPLCTTREQHIRVTARANAAAALYNSMMSPTED